MLLHLETGQYHGLNEIGCRIWELVDDERTAADVIEAIRAEVDDPPAALDDEVTGFIDAMRERDLILAGA